MVNLMVPYLFKINLGQTSEEFTFFLVVELFHCFDDLCHRTHTIRLRKAGSFVHAPGLRPAERDKKEAEAVGLKFRFHGYVINVPFRAKNAGR